ncbi:hypothetical protein, partial [Rhizobium sp. 18055]|uniref:hypothetical protein n=1 Tax=Rhizobium sp. 18055 TaxID=2681403 RepID=UPI001AEEF935
MPSFQLPEDNEEGQGRAKAADDGMAAPIEECSTPPQPAPRGCGAGRAEPRGAEGDGHGRRGRIGADQRS